MFEAKNFLNVNSHNYVKMKNITLSISEEIYRKMREHSEINWSEVVRKSIKAYLDLLKTESSAKELRELLPPEVMRILSKIDFKTAKRFSEKVVKEEWKRVY